MLLGLVAGEGQSILYTNVSLIAPRLHLLRRLGGRECVGLLWLGTVVAGGTTHPLNVLFLVADGLNTTIGCYDGDVLTPHLDELAAAGTLFGSGYCQEAVCSPSLNSVLSGLRPDVSQVRIGRGGRGGEGLRQDFPGAVNLPEMFQRGGYQTVSLGKIFHHDEVETGGPIGPRMSPGRVELERRTMVSCRSLPALV